MSLVTEFPILVELFEYPIVGKVERNITSSKKGRVQCMGTSWLANFYDSPDHEEAPSGAYVSVIGRKGNTLLITKSKIN